MDLNYLLHRHQVSLVRPSNAACVDARSVHRELAIGYAARITETRERMGARGSMVQPA